MPYNHPTFNLPIRVWRNPGSAIPPAGPVAGNYMGQLRMMRTAWAANTAVINPSLLLLVPKLTDIRGVFFGGNQDTVEVPTGSGRYYFVQIVDDTAKGFGNEYRTCGITQAPGAIAGPIP